MSHTQKQSIGNRMNRTLRCSEHPNPPHREQHHAEITREGRSMLPALPGRATGGLKEAEGQRTQAPHPMYPHLPPGVPAPTRNCISSGTGDAIYEQPSFGFVAVISNEPKSSLERTAHGEAQGSATWELYLQRRSLIRQFLHSSLSLCYLQKQQEKVHLLKRCSFYLDIEPKHVNVQDQHQVLHHTEILQLIDPQRLQRMLKMGKTQTQIQLLLLTELLEQLQQGWEELHFYVEVCDIITFFAQWDVIRQKLSKLAGLMETSLSLEFPGKICVKHSLVSHADLTGTRPPSIRLSLSTKLPVVFDRKESFALKDSARLKWFTENEESHLEQCELSFKLLTVGLEAGLGRTRQVSSNSCIVQDLKPGRSYEFTIRRTPERTLVFDEWRDTIILTMRTAEDSQSSTCAPEG